MTCSTSRVLAWETWSSTAPLWQKHAGTPPPPVTITEINHMARFHPTELLALLEFWKSERRSTSRHRDGREKRHNEANSRHPALCLTLLLFILSSRSLKTNTTNTLTLSRTPRKHNKTLHFLRVNMRSHSRATTRYPYLSEQFSHLVVEPSHYIKY